MLTLRKMQALRQRLQGFDTRSLPDAEVLVLKGSSATRLPVLLSVPRFANIARLGWIRRKPICPRVITEPNASRNWPKCREILAETTPTLRRDSTRKAHPSLEQHNAAQTSHQEHLKNFAALIPFLSLSSASAFFSIQNQVSPDGSLRS